MSIQMISPAILSGRCANGHERGKGSVVHAVRCAKDELRFGIRAYAHALCGKTHGARSAGWSQQTGAEITCVKCKKLSAQELFHG